MPISAEARQAVLLLERLQRQLQESGELRPGTAIDEDINTLLSVLDNPVFRGILAVQESLSELKHQVQQHPSILPVDFDITTGGELVVNLPPSENESYPSSEQHDKSSTYSKQSATPEICVKDKSQTEDLQDLEFVQHSIPTYGYTVEFQRVVEQTAQGREIHNIQLHKPDGASLGFSVVSLKSEHRGELGIFVQEIQPAGIAARDGRLLEGDQILAIDGQPLDSNISHQQAISILQQARGLVELVVARGVAASTDQTAAAAVTVERSPSAVSDSSKVSDMVLNTEWAQVEVIDLINDGSGLGFGIVGNRSTGVVVKTILPGGVADRDGRLQSGDHILQIGDVNLRGMASEQVAAVLRQSGSHVRLVVARPVEPTAPDYQALQSTAPIVPTRVLADAEELERHLLQTQNGYIEGVPLSEATYVEGVDVPLDNYSQAVTGVFPYELDIEQAQVELHHIINQVPELEVPDTETFEVELTKDPHQGLGITIAGYVCEKDEISGIFVKSVTEGSAADVDGRIRINDQIIQVDGISLQGYSNLQAVEVLRNTGKRVRLQLVRYLHGAKFEQLQQAIASSDFVPAATTQSASLGQQVPPSVDMGPSYSSQLPTPILEPLSYQLAQQLPIIDLGPSLIPEPYDIVEATNRDVLANRDAIIDDLDQLINRDYVAELDPDVETAILAKWQNIMGLDYEIVVAQMSKFREGGGLGISLEGTVDVEDGKEVRPHHYIRSVLPDGPVGINGKLQSGDELLEVNGLKLMGLNHVEVVSILKDLPMHVRMVCARRLVPLPGDQAMDPYHGKSESWGEVVGRSITGASTLSGSLQNLPPMTERLFKAKSDGSLAVSPTSSTMGDGTSFNKMKSRSLEPLTGLAMWSSEPQIIELVKGDRGLGFSILDYQDPMNPNETVIVIRSLVPGGVAQQDGRLIPGDRLMYVNDTLLENATLDQAVQALKGAPKGVVRLGVAKPLPLPDSSHTSSQVGEDDSLPSIPTVIERLLPDVRLPDHDVTSRDQLAQRMFSASKE